MSTTVTGNPTAAESPSPAPGPGAVPILTIPGDGEGASIASVLQAFKTLADFTAWLTQSGLGGLTFGDGSGGDQTMSTDTDLTGLTSQTYGGEIHYNNLTVGAGVNLYTKGIIIRVKNTLTIGPGGHILPDILADMQGGTGAGGSAGGLSFHNGTFGAAGGGSSVGGPLPDAVTNSVGGAGGAGGAGTAGIAAQPGGTFAGSVETNKKKYILGFGFAGGHGAWLAFVGGSGGGAGGGTVGYGGGAGGAGGAPLLVYARRLVIADNLALQSVGGAGGAGGTNGTNGGGGGGGGGGGYVGVVYGFKSGPALSATVVNGGVGGVGAFGGAPGSAGAAGNLFELNLG